MFDTEYDQRVSGFILCEDAPKITCLRPLASALVFAAISKLEMATAQRTRPRAVFGAPRRAAWQLKSVLRHSFSAAPRTIILYIFFTIIAGKLSEVESKDTRLEAKAKDTKKIRGPGQPFRGQNLSRLRTGMLEATDQGHSRKCSPKKKKVFKKVFQAISNS